MQTPEEPTVNYERALADAESYLRRARSDRSDRELTALLAAWAAEGEERLYPMPALHPERRDATFAA